MDEVVEQLVSYRTLILMVTVLIGTFFIRRIVETAAPKVKQAAPETALAVTYTNPWAVWWNQVILYVIPVALGVVLSLTIKDWMPSVVTNADSAPPISKGGLVIYGVLTGWFASFGYKVVRKALKQKTGIDLPSFSNPPPPGTDDVVVIAQDSSKVTVNVTNTTTNDPADPAAVPAKDTEVEVVKEAVAKDEKAS